MPPDERFRQEVIRFPAHYPNEVLAQSRCRASRKIRRSGFGSATTCACAVGCRWNPRPSFFNILQRIRHFFPHSRGSTTRCRDLGLYVPGGLNSSGRQMHGWFDFNPTYERLFERFEISPGVFLPPGEYRFTRFRSNVLSTAAKRPVSASINLQWGNYWSGEAEQVTASLTYKLPPRFTMSLSTNQPFARLPEGNFVPRIATATVNYPASPRLSFAFSFNRQPRNLGWQSRIRWTLRGQRFLFRVQPLWVQNLKRSQPALKGKQQGAAKFPTLQV